MYCEKYNHHKSPLIFLCIDKNCPKSHWNCIYCKTECK